MRVIYEQDYVLKDRRDLKSDKWKYDQSLRYSPPYYTYTKQIGTDHISAHLTVRGNNQYAVGISYGGNNTDNYYYFYDLSDIFGFITTYDNAIKASNELADKLEGTKDFSHKNISSIIKFFNELYSRYSNK